MKRNRKILVVDDQQDLREQLAKLLRKAGQKDETHSLIEQMRARLLGNKEATEEVPESDQESSDDVSPYIVEIAAQGEEAWNMVKEANKNDDSYAVMFLDMRMPPGWDGLETATKIREIDKNIEIVIMTAYADHDQAQIAEQVGMPEKLLYIKKPFQAEEIYQLALSLTSKYTLERADKEKKRWLESLLRGMSRLKSSKIGDIAVYGTVLNAIINFTQAKSGFIAEYANKADSHWINCTTVETEEKEALKYLEEQAARLEESRTTQNIEGKYILPLRKGEFFAVAVIDNVTTSTDPEWYKLLSLLMMTCSEVLNNAYAAREHLGGQRDDTTKQTFEDIKLSLEAIKKNAESLKQDDSDAKDIADKIITGINDALKKLIS
jgi:two-component system, NtrC family, sensor kinase